MPVTRVCAGRTGVVMPVGRLDLDSSARVKSEVRACLADGCLDLLLDLRRVEFINSAGLGSLVSVLKDVRAAGGRLVLCGLAPYILELFEVTHLADVFAIAASEEEGRAMLAQQGTSRAGV